MKTCEAIQESLVEVLADGTHPGREIEAHLAGCEACSASARELARVWALLGQDEDQPLPVLSRLRITGTLTRAAESEPRGGSYRSYSSGAKRSERRPLRTWSMVAMAAVVVLCVGTGYLSTRSQSNPQDLLAELMQRGQLRHVELELDKDSPTVRLTLNLPRQMELEGRAEDVQIQNVLTELLTTGDARSSTRGRACEALRSVAMDTKVRGAMLQALLSDPNPSVRLKAAEALVDQAGDPEVQQAFLKVLSSDPNPGLRVRAIDVILSSPGLASRPGAIDALREAATSPNAERYVQIRAAEFLRGL